MSSFSAWPSNILCTFRKLRNVGFRTYHQNKINSTTSIRSGINLSKNILTVDLRSDTLTCPSIGMKDAMMNACLGDDVYREDPTVKEFEDKVAVMTNKEKSLFVPSGTMGNLLSVMVHCHSRGAEVLLGDKSHLFLYEQGGIAQLGGIQTHSISTLDDGSFDVRDVKSKIRADDIHCPTTELICIENTQNYCGGRVLSSEWIKQISEVAQLHGLPLHMDGARVMNAAIASGEHVSKILAPCDSAVLCFSKGLGAPIGSVIVGSEHFIERCRRLRKVVGGGMRQVGILAAAGLYSLDHMVDRLADDHHNAKVIAKCINENKSSNVSINMNSVETNIGMIDINSDVISTADFCTRLETVTSEERHNIKEGIVMKMLPWSDSQVRFVTHFNVTNEMIHIACEKLKYVIHEIDRL